ncbi:hypothetical protein D9M68_375630 [compost metagenome]
MRNGVMMWLIRVADRACPFSPGTLPSAERKDRISALVMALTSFLPNSGSRCLSSVRRTVFVCVSRHSTRFSSNQRSAKSLNSGVLNWAQPACSRLNSATLLLCGK